ncbi:MAG: hypothetical protein KVP17_004633 [Porospora cf. gigantea B]|uniref:uncharacterized protein n=1 Tax=Porospora cf. gigantea B TaxID=2853592 RepID=UPI0035719FD3|nr:MAG: hypothetical protein KVP17_004633 [Porospora cf. gigantea B]
MSSESSLDNDSVPVLNLDQLPPPFRSKWTCARPKDEHGLAYESVKVNIPTHEPRLHPDAVYSAESLSDFAPETTAAGKGWARIGNSLGDCVVGRGAYGIVRRMRFQKNVYAVKSIAKSVTDIHVPLYAKEILAQTEINHTNVARLYRVFEDERSIHLVMEFCAGGNLYQSMKRTRHRRFDERTTFTRFMQLVSGLTAIHAAGFHHRDLKLENLLLDSNGVLKITDFGWVSPVLGTKKHYSFCGTLDYLPPEMLQGAGHDWRMDIWATGVLLYEMLVGRTAFNSTKHGTLISKVFSVQTNEYPPDIPQDFKDAVSSMLVYNEDRRLRLHGEAFVCVVRRRI